MKTQSVYCTIQINTHNIVQSFDHFEQMVECLFTNHVVVGSRVTAVS